MSLGLLSMTLRRLRTAILLLTIGTTLLAAGASAATCGQEVVDDWFDDEHVGETYALACYRDALELLPEDAQAYSSAPDEINRALQAAIRGQESGRDGLRSPLEGLELRDLKEAETGEERTPADARPPSVVDTVAGGLPQSKAEDEGAVRAGEPAETLISRRANSIPTPFLGLGGVLVVVLAGGATAALRKRRAERKTSSQ